jgi:hypothetical protein
VHARTPTPTPAATGDLRVVEAQLRTARDLAAAAGSARVVERLDELLERLAARRASPADQRD